MLTGHSLGAGIASLLAVLLGPALTVPSLTAPSGNGGSSDGSSSDGGGGSGGDGGGGSGGGSGGGGGGGGSGDGGGEAADLRPVHCYAFSPPAVLSLECARAVAGHVTSVVVADDMVNLT